MITLYSAPTPNGYKISILLEEMALNYKLHIIDLGKNEQKQPWFTKMNPNGRIPVIVDHDNNDLPIFESGAIMIYLAEKTGLFLSADPLERLKTMEWLMFQMGGLGPMQGQAHVFHRYFPEKLQSVINRYQGETRRLYEVLDTQLADTKYLAGEAISIADFANWCWVRSYEWAGVSIDGLLNLQRWIHDIAGRPAVKCGLLRPPRPQESDKVIKSGQNMLSGQDKNQ